MSEQHNHEHEHEDQLIILQDDEGKEIECAVLDIFDLDGTRYVALMETGVEDLDSDEVDVIMMKILKGETDDDDELVSVLDEDELQKAFDEFVARDEEDAD